MAGFAGILRLDGAPLDPSVEPILDAMGAAIAHRGLTARRVERKGPLGLVLPEDATLAFDGRGSPAARIEQIEGPFALALWDEPAQRLLLARDRLGIRPLFWARAGNTLLFGSEVKALVAHPACPREIDWLGALAHEAMPRRSHRQTSFVLGVEPLAAGTQLICDARSGTVEPRRWYSLPTPEEDSRSDEEIIAGYREQLTRAVTDALGQPTGLLLSGGIDSMSIAAIASQSTRLPTFTVLGQSTFGNGDAGLAHRVAQTFALPEHQVLFRVDEPITPDQWRRLLWLSESPLCAFQHYYKFHLHRHAREARPDLVTMLNGEGSDELSGADFRNHGENDATGGFDEYLADLSHKQREEWHNVETLGVEAWMGRPVFTRDFMAGASRRPLSSHPWQRRVQYCLEALQQDVLWRDDWLAAGCGHASETPFLDHRLVEYVLRIPTRAHPRLFWKKHMLRAAMADLIPDSLRHAPKIPFFGGVDSRFTTRLIYNALMAEDRALVREAFGDGRHPVLAAGLVDDILDDLARDPTRGAVQALLPLINLGLLERMVRDAAARPGPAMAIPALGAISEWDEQQIAARLTPERREIDPDAPLAFAPEVYLVRPDRIGAEPISYLVVNDEVRFVLDGEDTQSWREVLRRIDGTRSLRSILDELGLDLSLVRKHLEEAFQFGVLAAIP